MSEQWYVKYEGTDEISGPMDREAALSKAEQADGMVFSGEMFDSENLGEKVRELSVKLNQEKLAKIQPRLADLVSHLRKFADNKWFDPTSHGIDVPSAGDLVILGHAAEALELLGLAKIKVSVEDLPITTLLGEA